jgi:hypothetical protein
MKIEFRITSDLLEQITRDMDRPHVFAHERVGYVSCACSALPDSGLLILAEQYHPVADEHYLDLGIAAATINTAAIRQAMTIAFSKKASIFHIHRHEHRGRPSFGKLDIKENSRLVPDFFKVSPDKPHGALVLSHDGINGACWTATHTRPMDINAFTLVGRKPRVHVAGE